VPDEDVPVLGAAPVPVDDEVVPAELVDVVAVWSVDVVEV
jgi:hypothetical protein